MNKLSRLQKWILVSLLDQSNLVKSQRERNAEIYRNYFGCDLEREHLSIVQASLSRTYKRLESRGLIHRVHGKWQLTDQMTDGQGRLIFPGIAMAQLVLIDLSKESEKPDTGS